MSPRTTISDWLLCVPDAWEEPVREALIELDAIGVEIFDVKDKFRMLRIYVDYDGPQQERVYNIIRAAENKVDQIERGG